MPFALYLFLGAVLGMVVAGSPEADCPAISAAGMVNRKIPCPWWKASKPFT